MLTVTKKTKVEKVYPNGNEQLKIEASWGGMSKVEYEWRISRLGFKILGKIVWQFDAYLTHHFPIHTNIVICICTHEFICFPLNFEYICRRATGIPENVLDGINQQSGEKHRMVSKKMVANVQTIPTLAHGIHCLRMICVHQI